MYIICTKVGKNMDKKLVAQIRAKNPFMPLSDIAYEILLQEIVSFSLMPGSRLSESGIAQELGISRSPVKTALDRLVENKFVRNCNTRYYVSDFDEKEYLEMSDFVSMVEPYAAAKAAANISDDQLDRLYDIAYKLNDVYNRAAKGDESAGFVKILEKEMEFHRSIVRASGNELIAELYESKKYQMWRFRGYLLFVHPEAYFDAVDSNHVLICDNLKLHDRELAAAVVRRHLQVSRNAIERYALLSKPVKKKKQ